MATATAGTLLPTGTWCVDPAGSRVEFEAKHLGISAVRGVFGEFEGTLDLGDDCAGSRVHGSVSIASVDTKQEKRDAHLRSPAFFDAERFPRLTFESSEVRRVDAETFEVEGDLTMHGTTRPITLTAELKGVDEDSWGYERLELELTGRLNRSDYGMTSFKVLVSDRVELRLDIAAVKQA